MRLSQGLGAITGKKFKRKIDPVTIREVRRLFFNSFKIITKYRKMK